MELAGNKGNQKIEVSVIVIFDKIRKEKLTRLLNSLHPQINSVTEVLLIHESNKILSKPKFLLDFNFNLNYVNIPEKQGIPFNRNKGIEHAQGKIVVFIDDDCWVHDKWLSSLLKPLHEDENILAVTSETKIPQSNFVGDCISALGFPGGGSLGFEKIWKVSKEGFTNHLAAGNCALRKKVFELVGNFDELMKSGAEDAELSHRIEKAGISIKYSPEGYAFHEARTTISSFVKWQLRRGKANYQFKQKVGPVGDFVKLRIWSTKNIFKKNYLNPKLPIILSFLAGSFILQQIGYLKEKKINRK